MTIAACDKGYEGRCCCNCEHQRPVVGHPSNRHFPSKSIVVQHGYICMIPDPDFYPQVVFFESKHGMCEYWQEREYEKYSARSVMEALSSET